MPIHIYSHVYTQMHIHIIWQESIYTHWDENTRNCRGDDEHTLRGRRFEVLIGSMGDAAACTAQEQPSSQTLQHQSAPVTQPWAIGANIAILPQFTFTIENSTSLRFTSYQFTPRYTSFHSFTSVRSIPPNHGFGPLCTTRIVTFDVSISSNFLSNHVFISLPIPRCLRFEYSS